MLSKTTDLVAKLSDSLLFQTFNTKNVGLQFFLDFFPARWLNEQHLEHVQEMVLGPLLFFRFLGTVCVEN